MGKCMDDLPGADEDLRTCVCRCQDGSRCRELWDNKLLLRLKQLGNEAGFLV